MTGMIDLTYVRDGRWYVLDYKSNRLPGYSPDLLAIAMRHSEYDLQALIYTVALHRWLRFRLGAAYDYERDMGASATCSAAAWMQPATACMWTASRSRWWMHSTRCSGGEQAQAELAACPWGQRMSLLKELHQKGLLRTLDHALATSLQRLRDDTPDSVALAAARLAGGVAGPRRV